MQDAALFVLLGLGGGAVIAGIALAVVITYRGSGIINLSTGAVSMVAAYGFWALRSGYFGPEFANVAALAITMAAAVLVGVLGELLVFRPLRTSSPLAKLVASLGILLVLQATMLLWFGDAPRQIPSVFPVRIVEVFGNSIPVNRFWMAGIVVLITLALGALFRWTRFGLATRAASENEVTAMLRGLSPNSSRWPTRCSLGDRRGDGYHRRPALPGRLRHPRAVHRAGPRRRPVRRVHLAVDRHRCRVRHRHRPVADDVGRNAVVVPDRQGQPDARRAGPAHVRRAGGRPVAARRAPAVAGELVEKRLPFAPRPRRMAVPTLALASVGAVLLIVLPFSYRQALMVSMVGMVVCLSLVVITGFVGQVSLAQVTLAGVAGFAVSHMTSKAGIGFPWGPLVGSAAAVVIGLMVGASALRVRGVSLAVVTLAGVVAIEQFGFANRRWGAGNSGSPVEQPEMFGVRLGSNAGFRGLDGKVPSSVLGFVFLGVVVALGLLVASLRRSVLGQQMLSVRANERAAAAAGINVTKVKVTAYAISSFIAGTAGWMYAYNFGSVSAARFGILIALGFVAFAYIGGITMVSGAVVGGLVATEGLIPYTIEEALNISGNWTLLVGGVILIVTLIQNPEGIAGTTYRKRMAAKRAKAAAAGARAGATERDGDTMSAEPQLVGES